MPILFLLSAGVDPIHNLINYSQKKRVNIDTISLG